MAKTTATTTSTDTAAEAAAPLVVQQLDPRTLLLDHNIRTNARLDKNLVASVRQRGVIAPIVAVSTVDGGVRVVQGQRRTLAAIDAEQATVPVVVVGMRTPPTPAPSSGLSPSTPRTPTAPGSPTASRSPPSTSSPRSASPPRRSPSAPA